MGLPTLGCGMWTGRCGGIRRRQGSHPGIRTITGRTAIRRRGGTAIGNRRMPLWRATPGRHRGHPLATSGKRRHRGHRSGVAAAAPTEADHPKDGGRKPRKRPGKRGKRRGHRGGPVGNIEHLGTLQGRIRLGEHG